MKDERTELRERRTVSTKTYENPDHSFTKEIYLSPVHYQTEDGSWEEMDDTLTDVETPSETGNAAEKTQQKKRRKRLRMLPHSLTARAAGRHLLLRM